MDFAHKYDSTEEIGTFTTNVNRQLFEIDVNKLSFEYSLLELPLLIILNQLVL